MVNQHNQKDMYQANLNACYLAASEGFPHLTLAEIIEPPHGMLDAFLVRQIVMHIMVTQFCWPKKRVQIEEKRNRHTLYAGFKVIDERLTSVKFAEHYKMIANRALDLLAARIREAA